MNAIVRISLLIALSPATAFPQTEPQADVPNEAPKPYRCWPADQRDGQRTFEARLNETVSAQSLRAYHDLLGSEPHHAGTPGDWRTAERIAKIFTDLGLEVEKQEIWVYLADPIEAAVEIASPEPVELPLKETPLAEDPYSQNEQATIGWNAFSGNGDVTATVVYANRGTKEDFEKLKEIGVDVTGKIVIARYGGNYRGYKAKFAEQAGAAGLIIYTDPKDSGFAQGLMYPEGGYANPSHIQRGSIKTLPYVGDALTPFKPATKGAERLDPDEVALPEIPVQPIGYAAAEQILGRMKGMAVPREWQGGLPFTYRVTAGNDLTVRLMVKQERSIKKTFNVVGTLRGTTHPDQKIVIGCHHDAWTYGASDPLAGMIVVLESARNFAELARQGHSPRRSLLFAAWGAEEYGIIGSTEWVEAHHDDLFANGIAYLNLDMASMGPNFGSSAAPTLQTLIADAARDVKAPMASEEPTSVFDSWLARSKDSQVPGHPSFGHLGGGSDHVGFYCHLAIPSAGMGGGGSKGTSYHSLYDNLHWYRQVVGENYDSAKMVTRVTNLVASRLANAPLIPYEPAAYGPDIRRHLANLAKRAEELEIPQQFYKIERVAGEYEAKANDVYARLLPKLERGELSDHQLACVNDLLIKLERTWYYPEGLPDGRPWFKSLYAATDPDSGYSAWMLPAYRWSLERRDTNLMATARRAYFRVISNLDSNIEQIGACTE